MTSNLLDANINYYSRCGLPYQEAVENAVGDILQYIETDVSILQTCREQWYNRKATGTLTEDFDRICKDLAETCKRNISEHKKLLQ